MNSRSDGGAKPRTPRWVKVLATIGLIAVVAVVVLVLSGGNHGPGRHAGAPQETHQPPSGVPHR